MSKKATITWTRMAEMDVIEILEIIEQDSPGRAAGIWQNMNEAVRNLEHFPQEGRVVPELKSAFIEIYREIIVTPWRIIYKYSAGLALIITVIDSRRNVDEVLLEKLLRRS